MRPSAYKDSTPDFELLRRYVAQGSEDAFATLVDRYVRLVFSAALRQCRNVQDAEDITQAVFVILARKAGGLRQETILGGWLLRTTRFVAMNALRRQRHRWHVDREGTIECNAHADSDSAWPRMSPMLDEALERLHVKDRDAIVLRYFEQRSFKDIARLTAATEDGAQKRVTRAVDKLRLHFQRRGLLLSSAAILTAISAQAVQSAPVQLPATILAAAKSGTTLTGSVAAFVKVGVAAMEAARLKAMGIVSAAVVLFAPFLWFAAGRMLWADPLASLTVTCIASSANGTKLMATSSDTGLIYVSRNAGNDWHATGAPKGLWRALACSTNGLRLLAVGNGFGIATNTLDAAAADRDMEARVYTSSDSGASWTQASGLPTHVTWACAASSADGQKLAVAAELGGIHVSTNGGLTWEQSRAPDKRWNSIASSSDGNRLVALAATGGSFSQEMPARGYHYTADEIGLARGDETNLVAVAIQGGIYLSDDSGFSWTRTRAPQNLWWWSVACSEDRSRILAATTVTGASTVESATYPGDTTSIDLAPSMTGGGSIYVSSDAGAHWELTSAPSNHWVSLATSAQGTTWAAASSTSSLAGASSMICISRDGGFTWTTNKAPGAGWKCVAVTADGKRIIAGKESGGIQIIPR